MYYITEKYVIQHCWYSQMFEMTFQTQWCQYFYDQGFITSNILKNLGNLENIFFSNCSKFNPEHKM